MEWVLAARWAGYRWQDFRALDGEEQSFLVAAFRVNNQVEGLLSHEQVRAAKAKVAQARSTAKSRRRR